MLLPPFPKSLRRQSNPAQRITNQFFETGPARLRHRLPITTNKIIMVRNYRYPTNQRFLELPSGIIEKGETPEQCAMRELREETGYTCIFSYVTWYHPIACSLQKHTYSWSPLSSKDQLKTIRQRTNK